MSRVLIVDDSDPDIVYTGDWRDASVSYAGTINNEYMNMTKKSATPGDAMSYRWAGKQISVYGTLDEPATRGSPNARFSVDGHMDSLLNSTAADVILANPNNVTSHLLLYQSPLLSQGVHTISITLLPSSFVGAGAAPAFYFDFFTTLTDCVPPFSHVIVDDRDPSIEYHGAWVNLTNPNDYMQTSRMPVGGTAIFRFYGTELTIYGRRGSGPSHTRLYLNDSYSGIEEQMVNGSDTVDYFIYNVGNISGAGVSQSCFPASTVPLNNTAIIAGAVVGTVAILLIIVGAVFCFKRSREKPEVKKNSGIGGLGASSVLISPYNDPINAARVDPAQQNPQVGSIPMNSLAVSPEYPTQTPVAPPPQSSLYGSTSGPRHWETPAHATLKFSPRTEGTPPDSGKARFRGTAGPWPQQQQQGPDKADQHMEGPSPPSYDNHL